LHRKTTAEIALIAVISITAGGKATKHSTRSSTRFFADQGHVARGSDVIGNENSLGVDSSSSRRASHEYRRDASPISKSRTRLNRLLLIDTTGSSVVGPAGNNPVSGRTATGSLRGSATLCMMSVSKLTPVPRGSGNQRLNRTFRID
jgi:hypothetical protein